MELSVFAYLLIWSTAVFTSSVTSPVAPNMVKATLALQDNFSGCNQKSGLEDVRLFDFFVVGAAATEDGHSCKILTTAEEIYRNSLQIILSVCVSYTILVELTSNETISVCQLRVRWVIVIE